MSKQINLKENPLEKMVLFEIRLKQFTEFPGKEYYECSNLLSKEESHLFYRGLRNEIHTIWSFINSYKGKANGVHSIKDYNQFVHPVSEVIQTVSDKYRLTLKRTLSEELREAYRFLGEERYKYFMDNINQSR